MFKHSRIFVAAALLLSSSLAVAGTSDAGLAPKLESLVSAGNAEAAYHLGMMHQRGIDGVEKDQKKALELFRKAAEAGAPLGAYMLGTFYEGQGEGVVADDPELALKHKLVAAKAGFAPAQHDVAKLLYAKGETDQALEWLLASARQGDRRSLMALASLYSGEGKVAKDAAKNYAFSAILQAGAEKKSEKMQAWLKETRTKLTPAELSKADQTISAWKIEPSVLTLHALSGQKMARQLVAETVPAAEAAEAETRAAAAAN